MSPVQNNVTLLRHDIFLRFVPPVNFQIREQNMPIYIGISTLDDGLLIRILAHVAKDYHLYSSVIIQREDINTDMRCI